MSERENIKDDFPKWRLWLYDTIFGVDSFKGKFFDICLLIAIAISIMVVMLESVASFDAEHALALDVIEWVITILFSLEYIARLIASRHPAKYVFSFMGFIDLVSVLPTYLNPFFPASHAFLNLRIIRLIRVFRILKLTRYMKGADHIGAALWHNRHKIIVFLGAVLCIVVVMGSMLYFVEGSKNGFTSIPTSIYWAIVTLTTVGYGDIAPQTAIGQTIASFIMILGYAIIAVPTGLVTQEIRKKSSGISCKRCSTVSDKPDANYCYKCGERIRE